jgi:integrase
VIRHLSEAGNVRQGFFTEAEFRAVVGNLPDYLKDSATFAYYTGMRKGEVTSLRWEDVDGDVIRLQAENAKNGGWMPMLDRPMATAKIRTRTTKSLTD